MGETNIDAIGAQIERLVAESLGKTVDIGGVTFTTRPVHDVRKPVQVPAPIGMSTLKSLAEYVRATLKDGKFEKACGGLFVHVVSPERVDFLTGIFGDFNQRAALATANAIVPDFGNILLEPNAREAWSDPETFIIALQSGFVDSASRSDVLKLVGNIKWEGTQTTADDGVTQNVSTRVGLSLAAMTTLGNPWRLAPRRSFPDIVQPELELVLRIRGGGQHKKEVALFEADGGFWRNAAIDRIKEWLRGELPEDVPVYG